MARNLVWNDIAIITLIHLISHFFTESAANECNYKCNSKCDSKCDSLLNKPPYSP